MYIPTWPSPSKKRMSPGCELILGHRDPQIPEGVRGVRERDAELRERVDDQPGAVERVGAGGGPDVRLADLRHRDRRRRRCATTAERRSRPTGKPPSRRRRSSSERATRASPRSAGPGLAAARARSCAACSASRCAISIVERRDERVLSRDPPLDRPLLRGQRDRRACPAAPSRSRAGACSVAERRAEVPDLRDDVRVERRQALRRGEARHHVVEVPARPGSPRASRSGRWCRARRAAPPSRAGWPRGCAGRRGFPGGSRARSR